MTNEELMRIYQNSPEEADDAMIQLCEQNMGLIWDLAGKCALSFGFSHGDTRLEEIKEELASEGMLAFMEALTSGKYDEAQGMVTTYVYRPVKGAMTRWLEKNVSATELSQHNMAIIRKVQQMYYDYGTPTSEIARVLKITEAEVAQHLSWSKNWISSDAVLRKLEDPDDPDAENIIHMDGLLLQKNSTESVEHRVMVKIWLEKLPELFQQLRVRDKYILGHFYGIYGYEKKSKALLALELELSIDGVYKARDAAVERAKHIYHGSDLHTWRRAYVDTKVTATKGLK